MQFLFEVNHPEPDEPASVFGYVDNLRDAADELEMYAYLNDHDLDIPVDFGGLESDNFDLPWERTVDGTEYRIEAV